MQLSEISVIFSFKFKEEDDTLGSFDIGILTYMAKNMPANSGNFSPLETLQASIIGASKIE